MNAKMRTFAPARCCVLINLFVVMAMAYSLSIPQVHAISVVDASYSAGSKILDMNVGVSGASHPSNVAILPVIINPGPNADGTGQASGSYDVKHGSIKLTAAMTATAHNPLLVPNMDREHGCSFHGSYQDRVTITAPSVPTGTPGLFVPVIFIHRVLDQMFAIGTTPTPNTDASWSSPSFSVDVWINRGWLNGGYDGQQNSGNCILSAAFPPDPCVQDTVITWALNPFTFTYGVPFDLGMVAVAGTHLRTIPGGSAGGSSDLGATVMWLGVAAVALTNQTIISNYTFTAESGFNYGTKLQAVSNAVPTLTLEVTSPETVTVCWPSVPNQIYQLESRTNLSSGSWQTIGDLVVGDGSQVCKALPVAGPSRFYRVASVPNP